MQAPQRSTLVPDDESQQPSASAQTPAAVGTAPGNIAVQTSMSDLITTAWLNDEGSYRYHCCSCSCMHRQMLHDMPTPSLCTLDFCLSTAANKRWPVLLSCVDVY